MIPLAKPVEFISKDICFDITIKGYGENINDLNLYEDDGLTFNFENGDYNVLQINVINNEINIVKKGSFKGTRYNFVGFEHIQN